VKSLHYMLLMAVAFTQSGCVLAPPFYWAESIHGRVVDAETGAPIEGAVVVADWKLYSGGVGHGGHRDSLLVEATQTSTAGDFSFGKWGPKMRPAWTALDDAPRIVVLKRSYEIFNQWNDEDSNGFVRRSDANGQTIKLTRSTASAEKRLSDLRWLLLISPLPDLLRRGILEELPDHRHWPSDGDLMFRSLETESEAK